MGAHAAQGLAGSQPLSAVGWELEWEWAALGSQRPLLWGCGGAGAVRGTRQVVPGGNRKGQSWDLWSDGWCCGSESGPEQCRVLVPPLSHLSLQGPFQRDRGLPQEKSVLQMSSLASREAGEVPLQVPNALCLQGRLRVVTPGTGAAVRALPTACLGAGVGDRDLPVGTRLLPGGLLLSAPDTQCLPHKEQMKTL